MSIFEGSRYENSKVYKLDEKYFIGSRKILKKKNYSDNIIHTVIQGERLELIAYKYWGIADLYYIICDWNDIFNPLVDLEPGTVLTLPSFNKVSGGFL